MPSASPSLDNRVVLWPSQSLEEWKRNPTPGNQPVAHVMPREFTLVRAHECTPGLSPSVSLVCLSSYRTGLHKESKHTILPADALVHKDLKGKCGCL